MAAVGEGTMPGLDPLVDGSRDRITYALTNNLSPPTNPHSLSRLLDRHENAAEAVEVVNIVTNQLTVDDEFALVGMPCTLVVDGDDIRVVIA